MAFPVSGRKKHNKPKRSVDLGLNLTSMMDMFTIILVFLLKSYSATGNLIAIPKDYKLPESIAEENPTVTVNISVKYHEADPEASSIVVGDYRIGYDIIGPAIADRGNFLIPELRQILINEAEKEKLTKMATGKEFEGLVNIIGDKDVPYALLVKIMITCGQTEFGKINLLVQRTGA